MDDNALLTQRMEDSNVGPLWWFTHTLIKVRNGSSIKMLKMKVEPTMCMKTQAVATKCQAKDPAFYRKMQQLHGDRQQSVRLFGRRRSNGARIGAEWRGLLEPDLGLGERPVGAEVAVTSKPRHEGADGLEIARWHGRPAREGGMARMAMPHVQSQSSAPQKHWVCHYVLETKLVSCRERKP
jgi:hypothetical protein